jgi:hypothetical protein
MQTENLGDYIRQLREQAEMPLRKLAALLDIDQSTHFDSGRRRNKIPNQKER